MSVTKYQETGTTGTPETENRWLGVLVRRRRGEEREIVKYNGVRSAVDAKFPVKMVNTTSFNLLHK